MAITNTPTTPPIKPQAVQRMTKQRQAIINMLINSKDHPTAEEIFEVVRQDLPEISIGTVYRNLQMLLAEDLVKEIARTRSGARFDANLEPHSHFFCQSCGRVYDIPSYAAPLTAELQEQIPGALFSQRTDFFGVCHGCLSENLTEGLAQE